jgi:hypothetical protein
MSSEDRYHYEALVEEMDEVKADMTNEEREKFS